MSILENTKGRADLERRLEFHYWLERRKRPPPPLYLYPITLTTEAADVLEDVFLRDPKFHARIARLDPELQRIDFERRWGGKLVKSSAYLLSRKNGNVVVSDDTNQSPLRGLIERLNPDLATIPLNSKDLFDVSIRIAQTLPDFETEVYRLTVRLPGRQTIQAYNDVTRDQIQEYSDKGYSVERIKTRVRNNSERLLDFAVTRNGFVEFFEGKFDALSTIILEPLLQLATAKLRFYSNRGRQMEAVTPAIRPISLIQVMPGPLDLSIAAKLIERIKRSPRISYAIVHAGNPMLLVHILDERDGSGYDIAAAEDRVFIVPALDTSPSALVRARELVYRTFREGQVEDYYEHNLEPNLGSIPLAGV